MKTEFCGKALVVGNNIDTDVIYPGRFLELTDPKEIGSHCLAGLSEDIGPNFPEGGIVVAGTNFGCGSSREHAPIALINMGASAVLADSSHAFSSATASISACPSSSARASRSTFRMARLCR